MGDNILDRHRAVGGYGEYYHERVREGTLRLFSLRDTQNKPHVTIAIYPEADQLWVDQIKGKQNRSPVTRYVPAVQAFLSNLKVHYGHHPDCLGMGLVCQSGMSLHISEIRDEMTLQRLVAYDASLISMVEEPSKSLMWLANLRKPELIESLPESTEAMKISALLQMPLLMNRLSFPSGVKGKSILKQVRDCCFGLRQVCFLKLQPKRV